MTEPDALGLRKGLTPNLLGLTHTYYHSLRYHHMQMGNRTLT